MSHPIACRSVGAAVLLVGLAGCPTVDLGEAPVSPGACRPPPAYFEATLWPELIAPADLARSCVGQAGCHRIEDGRSALRLTTDPLDLAQNYTVVSRFLDCGEPESSSFLTKPMAEVDPHGGGDLFPRGGAEEQLFLDWFAQ
jgi:hypothetical protein